MPSVAHADCPAGFQNNLDVNVTTGVSVYFCTPLGDQNIAAYDPNLTPNAPVAAAQIAPAPVDATLAVIDPNAVAPLALAAVAPVIDPNDPFPLLAVGDLIPDTLVIGDQDISCPVGAGRALDFTVTTREVTTYCVKTYTTPVVPDPSLTPVVDTTLVIETTVAPVIDTTVVVDAVTSAADLTPNKLGGLAGAGSARGD